MPVDCRTALHGRAAPGYGRHEMPARELPLLLGTNHFRVLIGRRELGFSEVGRLSSETDLTLPPGERSHSFDTVVLRRALTRSTELFDWRRKIMSGKEDRRPVTIQQLESAGGRIVNSWRLEGAWPCRWSGPSFNGTGNDLAMEELELAYDGLVWEAEPEPDKPPPTPPRSRKQTEGA
jgi:phage tail-like protein